jgi:regulator of protease activity HflC (stomatin/prohibitin superfamily)
MDRSIKNIGLINLLVLLVIALADAGLAHFSKSWMAPPAVVFLGLGFLVAGISYFQMRLADRERLEKLEYDELRRTAGSETLFSQAADTFPAKRAREQFERWFVPAFTALVLLIQAGAVYWFWPRLAQAVPETLPQPNVSMSIYGLLGLVLFLLGKYSAGVARLDRQPMLRPGASYLLLGAYLHFGITAAIGAGELGFPKVDLYAARLLVVIFALAALETIVTLVLEIYRPRIRGQAVRVLYESRLIGLLSQPEGLVTTAAQALDYQFGFKVSQTWFYRFLEQAMGWIILVQVSVLVASTSLVIIEPNEQGLLERFGRPVPGREVLEPGLHLKWPWPIDRVDRYRTREIQSVVVGGLPDEAQAAERTVVWAKPHVKEEFNLLVASRELTSLTSGLVGATQEQAVPVNLLNVSIPIQYQVTNLAAWAYTHAEATNLLQNLATRELIRYLVNIDIDEVMGSGRLSAAEALRERIQHRANSLGLGVQILVVMLQHLHPPMKVVKDYEAVIGATHERATNILAARAYAIETVLMAIAEATNLVATADSDRVRRITTAAAESLLFTSQMAAFRVAPEVYPRRSYLEVLVRGTTNASKIVLAATNTEDVVQLNLEEKIRRDLLDVMMPTTEAK